ncbi:adenylyl-sulfate kinase [PVC group bacterium (ex Bugula neritina AB1)]|nr:adenylyl-sulfate kinase [PVC group bacterium (ex Bugula neritina AB1)]
MNREQMNIVVVGHVDHGKSTVIGRLMAETNALPQGKLEQVRAHCERNAKPFEYAFLLDALKDEQSQGITIDSARCFFKTQKRNYIIIDAPGHIEFLKNMITGAARAQAALLVIDADEGVQENSRRHGYMLSMLGIRQVGVCVNKMDLVDYSQSVFDDICAEYQKFLQEINVNPKAFIPISAREGDNMTSLSSCMPWFKGGHILEIMDSFEKELGIYEKELRFPLQDIYKFTEGGDDRRIFAGRVETGAFSVGDEVVFLPSGKKTSIKAIEGFAIEEQKGAVAGQSTSISLDTQIYVKPGEIMCKVKDEGAQVGSRFRVNIFWLGRQPMIEQKQYKLKVGTAQIPVWLESVEHILDASELSTVKNKKKIDRHDVGDCILQTYKPISFDLADKIFETSRFVIVDDYEIAGGGTIVRNLGVENKRLNGYIERRDKNWEKSLISRERRLARHGHVAAFVLITGAKKIDKRSLARKLEEKLFSYDFNTYYLGLSHDSERLTSRTGMDRDRVGLLTQFGELAHMFTEAGLILIASISDMDDAEVEILRTLTQPNSLVLVNIGENLFEKENPDLEVPLVSNEEVFLDSLVELLKKKNVIMDYVI